MSGMPNPLTQAEVRQFLSAMPFLIAFGVEVVSAEAGSVTVEMPFSPQFSGPVGVFPASMVGAVGDVAAVSSCLLHVPRGWGVATLDYTIKMTGVAKGEKLRAKGCVLQAGRTISVASAEVFAITGTKQTLCGTVLATTRNFEIKA